MRNPGATHTGILRRAAVTTTALAAAATMTMVAAPAHAASDPQLPWSGTFDPWTATTLETTVNTDYSVVEISVTPATYGDYRVSVYDDAGKRVCRSSGTFPTGCSFTSHPDTNSSKTYVAYVAADTPTTGPPTQDVRAVSSPITITNVGWQGDWVSFGPVEFGNDYQLIEAKVTPPTTGGYSVSVYREDGHRVCESLTTFPTICRFISQPGPEGIAYYAFVADNAPDESFPVNPRLTSDKLVVRPPDENFVYVAVGDSYQSGEGAGNSITDTTEYLGTAYENGSNYPDQVGPQENTYVDELAADGNRCHRALANYAKLNRDQLEPESEVVLIDETCSGALIEPAGTPAIVGTVGGAVDPDSQVSQVVARLASAGLTPDDVDLVTVGMGGNDAGFGDIVQSCVVPNLLRRVIAAYPDSPGEVEFLANHVASCANIDLFTHAGQKIDALQAKEQWAQSQLLDAFPNARIMQLDYPDILPSVEDAPAWCGGVSSTDIAIMRDRAARINTEISDAVAATNSPNLELVDVKGAFGSNPLCPGASGAVLANGFNDANVDQEIDRLLNVHGDGDPVARAQVDSLMAQYGVWRACVANKANPFDGDCDLSAAWSGVSGSVDDVIAYLETQKADILGNLVEPPGAAAESVALRYDRSRGLFHPTSSGQETIACSVLAAYKGTSSAACAASYSTSPDTVNGGAFGSAPVDSSVGDFFDFVLSGFAPYSTVAMTFNSEITDLGSVTADENGTIAASIQVPEAVPGVHRIDFTGTGAGGVQVVKEMKVRLPGDAVAGQMYGTYLCGFEPEVADDGVTDIVDVTVLGASFATTTDDQGCTFIEIPLPSDSTDVNLHAKSRLTGTRVTDTVPVVSDGGLRIDRWGWGVADEPGVNTANAGRAIPIAFRVVDADGRPVRDRSVIDLRSYQLECDSGDDAGGYVDARGLGAHALHYWGGGWWTYVWKTSKEFRGECRTFSVVLDHGGRTDVRYDFDRRNSLPWWRPGHRHNCTKY